MLYEKALAVQRGGYGKLGGDAAGWMTAVTGAKAVGRSPSMMTDQAFLHQCAQALEENRPVTVALHPVENIGREFRYAFEAQGVVGGSTYMVDCVDLERGTLTLRDPQGMNPRGNGEVSASGVRKIARSLDVGG
jgi:hypothetical protein